jgi:mRNA interferase RelE/StbE
MRYRIEFRPAALRDIQRLPAHAWPRIARAIDALADNPRPPGASAMQGDAGVLRIRVGEYRVVYEVRDQEVVVIVVMAGHRRDVYRNYRRRR